LFFYEVMKQDDMTGLTFYDGVNKIGKNNGDVIYKNE